MLTDLPWWFAVAALVVAAGFVVVGMTVLRRMRDLKVVRERAVPVSATVVTLRTERRRDSEGGTRRVVVPTVRYTDRLEQVHEADVELPGAIRLAQGDQVDIVYDPENPGLALPAGRGNEVVVGVAGGCFALLGVGIAIAVLLSLR